VAVPPTLGLNGYFGTNAESIGSGAFLANAFSVVILLALCPRVVPTLGSNLENAFGVQIRTLLPGGVLVYHLRKKVRRCLRRNDLFTELLPERSKVDINGAGVSKDVARHETKERV